MNRSIVLAILLCIASSESPLFSQEMHPYFYVSHYGGSTFNNEYTNKYEPDKETIIRNHIKSVQVIEKGFKFGEAELTGKILVSYLYDKSGNKLEEARYDDGVLYEKSTFKYDSLNRIIEDKDKYGITKTVYNGDNYTTYEKGIKISTCVITSSASGKTISTTSYSGSTISKVIRETYSPSGYIQNKIEYGSDGSVSQKWSYDYYRTNLLKKLSLIEKDGKTMLIFENEFDYADPQLKVISRKQHWHGDQYLDYSYKYGSDKLLAPRGEVVEYPLSEGGCCRTFIYDYDTSGRMIRVEYSTSGNLARSEGGYQLNYSNGLKTQIISFDETQENTNLKELIYSFY
jgi:hypothetical protein